MGDERDTFFAELLTAPEPVEIARAATALPDVVDVDDEWFDGAARDTLAADTSSSPRDAVGSAALTLDRELVRRPTRRRRAPSTVTSRPRGRGGRWAIAAAALVVAVLTAAVIANPAQRSADRAVPANVDAPASQAPVAAARPRRASRARSVEPAPRRVRRRARRARRAVSRPRREVPAAARRTVAARQARTPSSRTSPRSSAPVAVHAPTRRRVAPPAFTPGDLPAP